MAQPSLVYLVDDDADYQYLVQQVFNLFLKNHRIRFFGNGTELITAIGSYQPTGQDQPVAILLDIDMPEMDGFQTLAELKNTPNWSKIPVIMMTNRDQVEYREEALRLGAHSFLPKPIGLAEIQKEMTRVCLMENLR